MSTEGDDRVAANARGLTFNTTLRCVLRNMPGLLIGDVAERVGVAAPTIRYYESIGLLKAPARSATGSSVLRADRRGTALHQKGAGARVLSGRDRRDLEIDAIREHAVFARSVARASAPCGGGRTDPAASGVSRPTRVRTREVGREAIRRKRRIRIANVPWVPVCAGSEL